MKAELINVEEPVHVEQMQDIIGTPPMWLYRWGISIILAAAIICAFISSIINYPVTVQTHVKINSMNSPYGISLEYSGKLNKILVPNNSAVKKGDSLAIFENVKGEAITIKAPKNGELTYAGIIHENEQLSPNQNIFFISGELLGFYGEILISQNDINKVKAGQKVIIKLKNISDAPLMLRGTIKYITNDPLRSGGYVAEIDFEHINDESK